MSERELTSISKNIKKEEERKKLKPVIKTSAIAQAKKPLGKKLKEMFVSGGGDVKGYVLRDLVVPAVKNVVLDFFEFIFFDKGRSGSSRSRRGKYSYGVTPFDSVSYETYYRSEGRRRDQRSSR